VKEDICRYEYIYLFVNRHRDTRIMSDDDDMAFAMFLQAQFNCEDHDINTGKESKLPTSLVDDAWEVIDPVPDIRQLFLQFNDEYFDGLLGGVEVRWSPRMTL
jgi:hypothetical protein